MRYSSLRNTQPSGWVALVALLALACGGGGDTGDGAGSDSGTGETPSPVDPVPGVYRGVVTGYSHSGEAVLTVSEPEVAHRPMFELIRTAHAQTPTQYPVRLEFYDELFAGNATFPQGAADLSVVGDLGSGVFSIINQDGDTCSGDIGLDGRVTVQCALGTGEPIIFRMFREAAGQLQRFCGSGVDGEPIAIVSSAAGLVAPTVAGIAIVTNPTPPVSADPFPPYPNIIPGPRDFRFTGSSLMRLYEGRLLADGTITTGSGAAPWTVGPCAATSQPPPGAGAPPSVVGAVPEDGAVNVLRGQAIDVQFTEPVVPGSGTVTLSTDSEPSLDVSLTWSVSNTRVSVQPQLRMPARTLVTVTVQDFVDLDGSAQVSAFISSFTTEVDPAPIRLFSEDFEGFPTGDIQLNATGDWAFGEPDVGRQPGSSYAGSGCAGTGLLMDYSPNTQSFMTTDVLALDGLPAEFGLRWFHWYDLEDGDDGARLEVSLNGGQTFEVVPDTVMSVPYDAGAPAWTGQRNWTEVEVDLDALFGGRLRDQVVFRWTTATDEDMNVGAGYFVDDIVIRELRDTSGPPTVTEVMPANGATDVAADAVILVVFSEVMSVGQGSVILEADNRPVPFEASWNPNQQVFQITPTSPLPAGSRIGVQLVGFEDLGGTPLASSVVWSFSVKASTARPDPVEVAAGSGHSCMRFGTGEVSCWGSNRAGELGTGDQVGRESPTATIGFDSDGATKVEAGSEFTCALRASGTVSCWGLNTSGQSGVPGASFYSTPQDLTLPENAVEISVGRDHACAVMATSGEVHCWGSNQSQVLGNSGAGSFSASPVPVLRSSMPDVPLTNAISVDAGLRSTCAIIRESGANRVECWGNGFYGLNGSAVLGDISRPRPLNETPDLYPDVVEISMQSLSFGCIRRGPAGGEVWCFGDNSRGELGRDDSFGVLPPGRVSLPAPAVDIETSPNHACAVLTTGQAVCWGNNGAAATAGVLGIDSGETGIRIPPTHVIAFPDKMRLGDATDPIEQLSIFVGRVCAIQSSGQAWCWGAADNLGDLQLRDYDRYAAVPVQGDYRSPPAFEIGYCGNGTDDDMDGMIDFDDPDCSVDIGTALTHTNSILGEGHDAPPLCGSNIQEDIVLVWTAPAAGDYELELDYSNPILAVSNDRSLTTQLACLDLQTVDPVVVSVTQGQKLYLRIASASAVTDPDFTLSICQDACP